MTRDDIKAIWKKHGGSQHGPMVEHYIIEEQAFYRFAEELARDVFYEAIQAKPSPSR